MVNTTEFAPSDALAPFIQSYTYRQFNTGGNTLTKPWYASHESHIIFFLNDLPLSLTDPKTHLILKKPSSCDMVGMSTQFNGLMNFNGDYAFFQIVFRPHGFYSLFKILPSAVSEKIVGCGEIFDSRIRLLEERLHEADTPLQMCSLADEWLMSHLKTLANIGNKITLSSNIIVQCGGLVNIDDLAHFSCMSIRNFERSFMLGTGMSPKQLCCIARFNTALNLKLNAPKSTWTIIAHGAGYFDQMHLIKDFKRFCGEAPSSLLRHAPLLTEQSFIRVPTT